MRKKILIMNNKHNHKSQKEGLPHPVPQYYRVEDRAFDADWNELTVTERKGWRYLKRGDKQIGLSSLPDRTGATEPITFNYVFGGGHQHGTNEYYDRITAKDYAGPYGDLAKYYDDIEHRF